MTSKCPRIRRGRASRLAHDGIGDLCPASSVRLHTQPLEVIHADILQFFDPRQEIIRAYQTIPGLAKRFYRKSLSSSFVTLQSGQAMSAPRSGHSDYWSLWAHIFPHQGFYLKPLPGQGPWCRFEPNASPVRGVPIFQETLQGPPFFRVHIKTASFMKNSLGWAYSSAVPTADTPLPPDHCGFGLNHIKDKTRTNRDASFATNAIFCNHHRWVHLAFHHSSPLLLPKVIREQSGGCDIELLQSYNV